MKIQPGTASEIDAWMELVRRVKDSFPGLETEEALMEHRTTVLDFMERNDALCAKIGHQIVGVLLFSREDPMLCFLAVDPKCRRQHIAEGMVTQMLSLVDPEKEVVVTTYREGDPEGVAARAFYRSVGFSEGALKEEFESPVQEFVFRRSSVPKDGTGC